MVSSFTPNINLEEPARGDDAGTWDTPVNNNMTLIDLVTGANTTIGVGSGNVTLSIAQYRSNTLTLNSTLTQNVTITFPSTFMKPYAVGHLATGSSAFTITLATTVAGGQVVAVPPGEYVNVLNDGTNIKFGMLAPRVGTYWDYAGSSVPAWVSACTVPPFLNCDGTTFSSATYPQLAVILNGNTLPNSKGRFRVALDQGAGLISTAVFSSTNVGATGGAQTTTLSSLQLPKLVDPGHNHTPGDNSNFLTNLPGVGQVVSGSFGNFTNVTSTVTTGITYGSSSQVAVTTTPPAYIGGLTLIRAA